MRKNKFTFLTNTIGVISVILCLLLLWQADQPDFSIQDVIQKITAPDITLSFEPEELVYSGDGKLNLLEGVEARDSRGNDLTDQVSAVITADGTLSRKVIRYLIPDQNGNQVTEKRVLVMENYTGPQLAVTDPLRLQDSDLPDLIGKLSKDGSLSAQNGYGLDISRSVRCVREQLSGSQYSMTFSVVNDFQDAAETTVTAFIQGEVQNPSIKLFEESFTIMTGQEFDPLSAIETADNGSGSFSPKELQIDSALNSRIPGKYQIIYTLYNADKTAKTTKILHITVKDNNNG